MVCHIVHFVHRFSTGGLENVIVQLVNKLPHRVFKHTIIALTEVDPVFAGRLERTDVELIGLGKAAGQPFRFFPKVYRLLRELRPDVFHSCNLAALEFTPIARLANVPLRVHAEHGWDLGELGGKKNRYRILRKLYRPFVTEFISVSLPLYRYLAEYIGINPMHLHLIPNGVDTEQFRPRQATETEPHDFPFKRNEHWVIGFVGRLVDIKNPMLLVEAFIALAKAGTPGTEKMRLAIVGEGELREQISAAITTAGLLDRLWLPGVRSDVATVLRSIDCFVLPSLSEATSCTLQEAMATGLAIVATNVGGNADLLEYGICGTLVPTRDASALAAALVSHYVAGTNNPQIAAAQVSIHRRYGLDSVMQRYREIFLNQQGQTS